MIQLMKNFKIVKRYVWVNLYFFVIIAIFTISFMTFKLIELKAKSNINLNVEEDLLLRWQLQDWNTTLEDKIFNYIKNWEAKLFYISSEAELKKVINEDTCYKKAVIIENWKNFQEIDTFTLTDSSQLFILPVDHIYLYHCYYNFRIFDYVTLKLK